MRRLFKTVAKTLFYRFQFGVSSLAYPYFRARQRFSPKNQCRILMYHSTSEFPKERHVPYDNVPPPLFERHMSILAHEGYNVITMGRLLGFMKSGKIPPKTVVITFDDGFKNNYLNAFPVLKRYGFEATFFIIADSIGRQEPFGHLLWDRASSEYFQQHPESRLPLSVGELRAMHSAGMEIGSHSTTHRSVGNLVPQEAREEIAQSKKTLEALLSVPVRFFAYPFGAKAYSDYNNHTGEMTKAAGFEAAVVSEIGAVREAHNLFELPRMPVREADGELGFKQKITGAYDWVNLFKNFFQRYTNRIDKVS